MMFAQIHRAVMKGCAGQPIDSMKFSLALLKLNLALLKFNLALLKLNLASRPPVLWHFIRIPKDYLCLTISLSPLKSTSNRWGVRTVWPWAFLEWWCTDIIHWPSKRWKSIEWP